MYGIFPLAIGELRGSRERGYALALPSASGPVSRRHSRRNRDSRLTTNPPRQMYYVYYAYYLEQAMRRVTAREANQRFSEVLSAVETGEQVVITKRGRPVALMSPYPAEALAAERQAAIDRMIASMNEPVTLRGGFRTFTRDEMHEC